MKELPFLAREAIKGSRKKWHLRKYDFDRWSWEGRATQNEEEARAKARRPSGPTGCTTPGSTFMEFIIM